MQHVNTILLVTLKFRGDIKRLFPVVDMSFFICFFQLGLTSYFRFYIFWRFVDYCSDGIQSLGFVRGFSRLILLQVHDKIWVFLRNGDFHAFLQQGWAVFNFSIMTWNGLPENISMTPVAGIDHRVCNFHLYGLIGRRTESAVGTNTHFWVLAGFLCSSLLVWLFSLSPTFPETPILPLSLPLSPNICL